MALAGEADEELPVLRRLAPFLKEHGLTPAAPAAPAMDLGALGPPLWSPPPAPEGLPRERPLLALFFLGSGCSHCVAQLGAFQAAAGDFRAAGIKIAAISTEAAGGPGDVSFEVRPDPTLALFKAFGCTDDFEKAPLHGTFLIDEEGRIRWGEISFTPFMEAAFLLEESRRLLSLRP
jgi:peroxiredoxin